MKAFVWSVLMCSPAHAQSEDDVVINEFVVNPAMGKEYVELLVTKPGGVNMQGWTLSDVSTRTGSAGSTEGDLTLPASATYLQCVPEGTYVVLVLATPSANSNTLTEDTSHEDGNNRLVLIAGLTEGMIASGATDVSGSENIQLYAGSRAVGALIDQVLAGANSSFIAGAAWGDNNGATMSDNVNGGSAIANNAVVRFVPASNTPAGFQDNDTGARFMVDANSYGTPGAVNTAVASDSAVTNPVFSMGTVPSGCYTGMTIGGVVSLAGDVTLHGALTLNADLSTGSFTLTRIGSGASSGGGDVVGNVRRTGFVAGGPALSFGNAFNSIGFGIGGILPSEVVMNLLKSAPAGMPSAIGRTYTITPTGGDSFSATLRLHYLDAELNGNIEATLKLFRMDGAVRTEVPPTGSSLIDNWVERSGLAAFSPWTMASAGLPAPVCALSPISATNGVGTSHTVMVDLTAGNLPLSGVAVSFGVAMGPNAGAAGAGITDITGRAAFTYVSNGQGGTDTIVASGVMMGAAFSCTATKTWLHIPSIIINEVDSDTAGADTLEFIELYDGGLGNTSLSGLVVVLYNGGEDKSYAAFDLDGFATDANGYFMLGSAAVPGAGIVLPDNTLQNGADAVALYVGNASDFPNGTPVSLLQLVDALVYDTGDPDDPGLLQLLNPGQPQVNESGGDDSSAQSNQRCSNGSGGARNTDSYFQAAPTPGGDNVCPPPLCALEPAGATHPAGANHSVRTTVKRGNRSLPGVAVSFTVTQGPNAGASGSTITDAAGIATFTYTSNGAGGADTILAGGLTGGDRFSCTATVTWTINRAPVARCRKVTKTANNSCRASVTTQDVDDGTSDPDGDRITLSLRPPGPYPLGTTTVTLTATDSHGASSACTAEVTVMNSPPIAAAGPDPSVPEGAKVTLSAAASSDPDAGQTLSYQWTQLDGPPVVITNGNRSTATFVAPEVPDASCAILLMQLKVTDPCDAVSVDSIKVQVGDTLVLADDFNENCVTVTLNCPGDTGNYCWRKPDGTKVSGACTVVLLAGTVNVQSIPTDANVFQGGADLVRRRGSARLTESRAHPTRTSAITDTNIDNSTCRCP